MLSATAFFFAAGSAEAAAGELAVASNQSVYFLAKPLPRVVLTLKNSKKEVAEKDFANWITINPALIYSPEHTAEIERIDRCPMGETPCLLTAALKQKTQLYHGSFISPRPESILNYLESIKSEFSGSPKNALFGIEDGRVIVKAAEEEGFSLNVEKSTRSIEEKINLLRTGTNGDTMEIPLVFYAEKPEIASSDWENIDQMGLIGEGKSNFRGSPKNRIHNIQTASQRFDGIVIKPNEEFSFVSVLGPVDGEHNYLPELVIKQNKTEPEFGGGICQVSTTMFRAAIMSGMKITARKNHAYPVAYYNPQGMDATVYIPRPDLRFINNTSGPILVELNISGTELTYRFYGVNDGRKVEITGPTILKKNPDGSMLTTFTQKVTDTDRNLFIDDEFKSAYSSPSRFPHPGETVFTEKPKDWSKKQWSAYKDAHNL